MIAPPPRAQLGAHTPSPPSPGPENEGSIHHHETGSSNASSKDGGASLAAKERESILLKEKDDRIAQLEAELVVMESEFARELDKLSQNESETASFWQAKHSNLHQQFLRTDTELRLMRSEVEIRDGEREGLKETVEILKRELTNRDKEIHNLRSGLMGLKKWVSTSTKTDTQTSDDQVADDMARLRNGLQNWVITHFRRAKLDLSSANKTALNDLSQLIPVYGELVGPAKVHLLQSIVSSILVEMIFDAYFVGLSKEKATQLKRMESYLASLCSGEAVSQWRATTLTMVRAASQNLQIDTAVVTEDVIFRVNRILSSITDAKASDARDSALRLLINNTIELARLLSVQKAVFRVTMPQILPHQKTMFDPSEMEDIGGEDEERLTAREICCVTSPSIVKSGDEHGSHPQFRNVIAKARVLCAPE